MDISRERRRNHFGATFKLEFQTRVVKHKATGVVSKSLDVYNRRGDLTELLGAAPEVELSVPELPEVETIVRELRPRLVGKRITALDGGPHRLRRPWSKAWKPLLLGRRISALPRPGQWIILELEGDRYLVIHLGMTGQLRVYRDREPVG